MRGIRLLVIDELPLESGVRRAGEAVALFCDKIKRYLVAKLRHVCSSAPIAGSKYQLAYRE